MFLFFISYILVLNCQDLVLKDVYSGSNIKSCNPELILKVFLRIYNSLQNIHRILLKMYHEIKLFQVCPLQLVPVLSIKKKSCFNTFHYVDSFFLICKFTIFLLIKFFLYILWIKIDEFSHWQSLILCLTSSQDGATNINCIWSFIQNQLMK